MQFIDLKKQYSRIKENVAHRMDSVLTHGQYILGPEVAMLEERLAHYVGVPHCIGVASGTDALLIALMALHISPGDEVITSPFSFIASASMIKMLGATPVFVDIDPDTYNINPELIERAITPKTRALLVVNLYGQCADYAPIQAIAEKYHLPIIEDAAQSFGATYLEKYSCSFGTIACTSFFPSKPLGGYGDGGACFTSDASLAEKMDQIQNHGQNGRYHHVRLGMTGRLDTLQAAILLAKLEVFEEELHLRAQVAKTYDELLADSVTVPYVNPIGRSVYAQYTIQVADRDNVARALQAQNIPTAIHYPVPINRQPLFAEANPGRFPQAEAAASRVLSLPFHPYMQEREIHQVAGALSEILCDVETT